MHRYHGRTAAAFFMAAALTFGTGMNIFASTVESAPAVITRAANIDMESNAIEDAIFRIGFNAKKDVTDKEIFASVYDSLTFGMVEVHQMKVGDTIDVIDGEIVIESIDHEGSTVLINGGAECGGLTLWDDEEGTTFTAIKYDMPVFVMIGQAQLTFDEKVTLQVYKMNDDLSPAGDYDTFELTPAELHAKLDEVSEKLGENFNPQQFEVRTEKGLVKEVKINYIP